MVKMTNDTEKLLILTEEEGFDDPLALLEDSMTDSVVPGICVNPENLECSYICRVEPDQDKGYCENCRANTVKSCIVLGGIL